MYLIYLDESGNTGARKDPDQPVHLIAGLIVHESRIRTIEEAVFSIIKKHYGVLILTPGFELHGTDLYGGNGFFKGVDPAARIACIYDIIDALKENEAKIIWSAVDKMKLYSGRHPHQMAFLFLCERVEDWLSGRTELGLLVADENKEIEQRLIDDLDRFKSGGTAMGWRPTQIGSIVDSIHFVQSVNNKLIQCADLMAYFILKHLRQDAFLLVEYLALAGSKAPWPTWREAKLSVKQRTIHDMARKIEPMVVGRKFFP